MALRPNASQIPAQRAAFNERGQQNLNSKRDGTPPPPEIYVSREWYRFLDNVHTFLPAPSIFTPTLTPGLNVSLLTAGGCFFNHMGSVVTLTGTLVLTTAAAGETTFTMAPPVLETLSLSTAAGFFSATTAGSSAVGTVSASAGNLAFRISASGAGTANYVFTVNYQIV